MAGRISKILSFIGSRTFAVWTLGFLIAILTASAFLPNRFTVTEEEALRLMQESPFLWKLSENFSTPEIVSSPLFIAISFFLGVSTFICTAKRFRKIKKRSDFSKRQAFSFSIKGLLKDLDTAMNSLTNVLKQRRWILQKEKAGRGVYIIRSHKGGFGFWGSMIFHVSLIALFVTGVISAVSRFNSEIILTRGFDLSTADVSLYSYIDEDRMPPAFSVKIKDLSLETKGRGITQVSGSMLVDSKEYKFSVNNPVTVNGYQFSPSRYGVAPLFVIRENGQVIFDSIVNLRSLFIDDYFEIKDGLRFVVRFYPDFFSDGKRLGTRTFEEKNPVFHIKVLRNGVQEADFFIKKGETYNFGEMSLSIPEYTSWVAMEFTRDVGVLFFIIFFFIGLLGLCVRFISNERVITVLLYPDGSFEIRGWSRYYPAFLEKEITTIRDEVTGYMEN